MIGLILVVMAASVTGSIDHNWGPIVSEIQGPGGQSMTGGTFLSAYGSSMQFNSIEWPAGGAEWNWYMLIGSNTYAIDAATGNDFTNVSSGYYRMTYKMKLGCDRPIYAHTRFPMPGDAKISLDFDFNGVAELDIELWNDFYRPFFQSAWLPKPDTRFWIEPGGLGGATCAISVYYSLRETPEPSSIGMLLIGLIPVCCARKARRRHDQLN